ncbi:hypothetical protein F5884DRAFT_744542 [Xylogone sp. PMI_703]|nr:hypothetical protein F5884DRAFT_744542 [Xylogone sp. PMI_703]
MPTTVIIPPGPNGGHYYDYNVRYTGGQNTITIQGVLDDTGSDYLDLYQNEINSLNLPANYPTQNTQIQTANGTVTRRTLRVEIQLVHNGNAIGNFVESDALILPGASSQQTLRCSGTFVRRNFFTATSPITRIYTYLT